MKNLNYLLTIILSIVIVTTDLIAQKTYDDSFFQGMEWRNIGPKRGGRSLAASGSPGRRNEYYFGAVGGGLWKTTDSGQSWKPVTDGQLMSSSVGAVAVSETNPDVIYIGMGETELRGNIMQGDGVYKSTDGGETWRNVGLKDTETIAKVRVHPTNPDIVYVAALGHPYGKNEERGVFRSKDGGNTWEKIKYISDQTGAIDLVIDRTNPNVLYASFWQVYRTAYKMWGGGPECGLYKSTDGGDTWTELTKNPGMPEAPIGKIGISVSPVNPQRVFAQVEANEGGLFRSDDGGKTWEKVNNERKLRQRAFYYSRVYADTQDEDVVYVLNVRFWKSVDGGKTFDIEIDTPHGDHHDMWIDINDPQRMIVATDGGGSVSVNGGETFTDQDYATSQFYHIMTTKDFPYHVCGAQQDNSTMCIPSEGWGFKMARGPSNGEYYYPVGGGESGYITQDPKDLDIFYAGSQGALLTKYNRSNGQIRDLQVYPRFFSGDPSKDLPERWQWTFPIIFSPVDNNRLYTCSQHVWYSTNGGQKWEKISPDLTIADPATLDVTGGVITKDMNGPEIYATVFALAPSYHDVNTIWAGSDDGLIHITRDHGKNWENITPPDMIKDTRVSIIEASKHTPGTAYVAAKRYQMDDRKPYLWKTSDYGKTWTKIVNGIREDDFLHVIREDPTRPGLLYAGGEHQAWVSFDDGENWQTLQVNMPDTQVTDLSVTEKDLVAGTHGRSVFILDDIAPIREMSDAVAGKSVHLYKPYTAYRRVQDAVIQYYLKDQADEVKIEVLDERGNLIEEFIGTEPEVMESNDPSARWLGALPKAPTTAAGLNRWEWKLRYPGATSFDGMIIWSARPQLGPWAPPGNYQVRLTVGQEVQTHSFEIKLDPRQKDVAMADVQEQFKMALQIRDETTKANEAVIQIRDIKGQLEEQVEGASKSLKRTTDQFIEKISAVEQELYQVQNRSNQDPLNFPIKINNRLAYLRKSMESGDGAPTDGARKVFNELQKELKRYLDQLNYYLENDLPKVNDALKKSKKEQVVI